MDESKINIDELLEVIQNGGAVKTGIDIYDEKGVLILGADTMIFKMKTLRAIKKKGLIGIPVDFENEGGMWDKNGKPIKPSKPEFPVVMEESDNKSSEKERKPANRKAGVSEVEKKIKEIEEVKKEALFRYKKSKICIKKVISDIQRSGGEFDYELVEDTVNDLFNLLSVHNNAFSYLSREIFSYDDYLYNHSINVCTIGTAVLKRFNKQFSHIVNNFLNNNLLDTMGNTFDSSKDSFIYLTEEEIRDISMGYFLFDVGKVLIPNSIIGKKDKLTDDEFLYAMTHSFEKGIEILEKNKIRNQLIHNIVKFHHSPIYPGEPRCYPDHRDPIEIPVYVKICKLADIYDAMTSKRPYSEAENPTKSVTEIFRNYANKDRLLQFLLHAFVKTIGIYPPGSVVFLKNGQMAYVLDSVGPIVLPFTDQYGITLNSKSDPVNLGNLEAFADEFRVDTDKSLITPIMAYGLLPQYIKESLAETL